jgi:hypothetical protein
VSTNDGRQLDHATLEAIRRQAAAVLSSAIFADRNPDELVWKHLKSDTVGRTSITSLDDFRNKVKSSMLSLQRDPAKIRSFRKPPSDTPPERPHTYVLINTHAVPTVQSAVLPEVRIKTHGRHSLSTRR